MKKQRAMINYSKCPLNFFLGEESFFSTEETAIMKIELKRTITTSTVETHYLFNYSRKKSGNSAPLLGKIIIWLFRFTSIIRFFKTLKGIKKWLTPFFPANDGMSGRVWLTPYWQPLLNRVHFKLETWPVNLWCCRNSTANGKSWALAIMNSVNYKKPSWKIPKQGK